MLISRLIASFVMSLTLTSCAAAQPTTAPTDTAPLSVSSSVDQILDALERQGHDLRGMSANVRLATADVALGNDTIQSGKFWLDNGTGADASPRARVLFDRKEANGRAVQQEIEYVLANGRLIDRNYAKKAQATHVVLKPGEKMNLLKLGEGPFPLPIGQKRADVYAAFEVKKVEAKPDDPAGTVHVQLVPKSDTALARKFQSIDVWVNVDNELPQRIVTLDPAGNEQRTTDLSDLKINPDFTGEEFKLRKIDESEWNIVEDAYDAPGR